MSRRQDVISRILVPIVEGATFGAAPGARGKRQRFDHEPAFRAAFAARKEPVHEPELPAVPGALVGEHLAEGGHAQVANAPGKAFLAHHATHIQILDADHIKASDQVGSKLGEMIPAAVAYPGVEAGNPLALAVPTAASPLTSGKDALQPAQPCELLSEMPGIGHALPVGERRQTVDAEINPHARSGPGKRFHRFVQAETRKVTPSTVLGYRNRAGRTRELPGPADAQVPNLGESEVHLLPVPPEGGTGELGALLPAPRLEAGIGRPLREEVAVGRLQVPEALLEGNTGDIAKPLTATLLFPLGKGGARLAIAHRGFILGVSVFPQTKRPVIDIPDTPESPAEGAPLGSAWVEPESVPDFHSTSAFL